jgi:predicted nucleic-acid-binding protein
MKRRRALRLVQARWQASRLRGRKLRVAVCAASAWSRRAAVIAMLETPGIEFEHAPTVEEALDLFEQCPWADFADCLLVARATHLGRDRFLTFGASAAKLPCTELVQ